MALSAGPFYDPSNPNSQPTLPGGTIVTGGTGNLTGGAGADGHPTAATTPAAPATTGGQTNAPTMADIYGPALDDAYKGQQGAYSASGVADTQKQTRTDVLSQFQGQIDGLDRAAAEARARIASQLAPAAAAKVGGATAISASRGLGGSSFGQSMIDNANRDNATTLVNTTAASDADYAKQKSDLLQFIQGEADKESQLRIDASQKGADAKIKEIQDRQTRAQASATASVGAMIQSGITDPSNPNYKSSIDAIAKSTGLSSDEVASLYTTAKQAADATAAKAAQDAATLAKTKADTAATKTPEQIAQEESDKHALTKSEVAKNEADAAAQKASAAGLTTTTNLPQVNMTAANKPDPAAQASFLNSISDPTLKTLVQGIASYSINPSSIPTRQYKGVGGLTQSQVLALVKQYDPSFSESQYSTRQALVQNFTSGAYSKNINSLNTAVGHIADILGNTKDLGNTGNSYVNAAKNGIASLFGSGAPGKASLNIKAATSELATVFKGTGATDDEIKALGTVDQNSSPDQIKQYIEGATQLLASRLQALTDTYTAGMGKAPDSSFLSPTSKATLQNLQKAGLNIQVPGLNPDIGDTVSDASGVADGTTATGDDGKTYVAQGGQWVAQ